MKISSKIFELGLQIIPVMIGVWLGFIVTDWSEGRSQRKKAEVFLDNVRSEIQGNREHIESLVDYHQALRDSCGAFLEKDLSKLVVDGPPDFFQGLRFRQMASSAFDTGIQTGIINELELDEIQSLNKLYTFQEDYNGFNKIMLNRFMDFEFVPEKKELIRIIRFVSITMGDVTQMESTLIKFYKEAEENLK